MEYVKWIRVTNSFYVCYFGDQYISHLFFNPKIIYGKWIHNLKDCDGTQVLKEVNSTGELESGKTYFNARNGKLSYF